MATSTTAPCGCARPAECVDRRAGRYLTAVYWLTRDRERARTTAVGDRLDVSPATVTERFVSLAADGFVDYEKNGGVALTARGARVARELAWRQCVVRSFFAAELGVEFDAGDGYRVGFTLSRPGVERLGELAGHPASDCPSDAPDCACEARAN